MYISSRRALESSWNHPDHHEAGNSDHGLGLGDAALLAITPLPLRNAHAVGGSIQQHVRVVCAHIVRYMFPSMHFEDAVDTSGNRSGPLWEKYMRTLFGEVHPTSKGNWPGRIWGKHWTPLGEVHLDTSGSNESGPLD
jgi:hypothetical protein